MSDDKTWLNNLSDCYESYSKKISDKNKDSGKEFFGKYVNNNTINNLIDAMNILLQNMNKPDADEKEKLFVTSLSKNFNDIPL